MDNWIRFAYILWGNLDSALIRVENQTGAFKVLLGWLKPNAEGVQTRGAGGGEGGE